MHAKSNVPASLHCWRICDAMGRVSEMSSLSAPTTGSSSAEAVELRRIAVRLAEQAASHIRARRPEVFDRPGARAGVQTKSTPTDPVTVVDTETEQLIRDELARLRPDDHVLGEEGGGDVAAADADTVLWVVDPIDGTVNFLYGIPAYAVSVAAVCGGRLIAGAVVDVAFNGTYSAAIGHGATRTTADGAAEPLGGSLVESLPMTLVATGFGYGVQRRARQAALIPELLPHVRDIRRMGSAALDLCMVAEGRVDAFYEHGLSPWDWAAGALIAAEAGAYVAVPPVTTSGAAGVLVAAAAPGVGEQLLGLFDKLAIDTAIPEP